MKEKSKDKEGNGNKLWTGLFLGVFVSIFLYTVILYYFLGIAGLRIRFSQTDPATLIREQIKEEVALELDLLLEKLKIELPARIASSIQGLERIIIHFDDGDVSLPQEVVKNCKKEFQSLAEKTIISSLNEIDLRPYVEELGQASFELVRTTLEREVAGKTYFFPVARWLRIPITVVAE